MPLHDVACHTSRYQQHPLVDVPDIFFFLTLQHFSFTDRVERSIYLPKQSMPLETNSHLPDHRTPPGNTRPLWWRQIRRTSRENKFKGTVCKGRKILHSLGQTIANLSFVYWWLSPFPSLLHLQEPHHGPVSLGQNLGLLLLQLRWSLSQDFGESPLSCHPVSHRKHDPNTR